MDLTRSVVPQAEFDAALVDAPCSTDRHLLQSDSDDANTMDVGDSDMAHWSPSRFKRDATRQVSLLLQALRSVRIGGVVVYATCSLSLIENDGVIEATWKQCQKWIEKGRAGKDGIQVNFVIDRMVHQSELVSCKVGNQHSPLAKTSGSESGSGNAHAAMFSATCFVTMPFGEATKYGWMILPDQPLTPSDTVSSSPSTAQHQQSEHESTHGFGPLYICRLRRVSSP